MAPFPADARRGHRGVLDPPLKTATGDWTDAWRGRSIRISTRPQIIHVTEGVGLCQRRGGPIELIRPGDRVYFEPGEEHWHGAVPNRFMTHLAMQEVDDHGSPVAWGEHVTDEEYSATPAS